MKVITLNVVVRITSFNKGSIIRTASDSSYDDDDSDDCGRLQMMVNYFPY
jgi:hypothetical protein